MQRERHMDQGEGESRGPFREACHGVHRAGVSSAGLLAIILTLLPSMPGDKALNESDTLEQRVEGNSHCMFDLNTPSIFK